MELTEKEIRKIRLALYGKAIRQTDLADNAFFTGHKSAAKAMDDSAKFHNDLAKKFFKVKSVVINH